MESALTGATGVMPDGMVLLTATGLSTVVSSLDGTDACQQAGGCEHLTADSWLPYLRTNAATGGFTSVGTWPPTRADRG